MGKKALISAQNLGKERKNFRPLATCPFCRLIIETRQEQIDLSTVKSRPKSVRIVGNRGRECGHHVMAKVCQHREG